MNEQIPNQQETQGNLENSANTPDLNKHLHPKVWVGVLIAVLIIGGYGAYAYVNETWPFEQKQNQEATNKDQGEVQTVLADKAIINILNDFLEKPTYQVGREGIQSAIDSLFRESLSVDNAESLIGQLASIGAGLNSWGQNLADAPDGRAYQVSSAKFCIAESIIKHDLKSTADHCGYNADFSFSEGTVDDLVGDAQILPFLLSGYAYSVSGDLNNANTYFQQIFEHKNILSSYDYVDLNSNQFDLYNAIYDKALSLYSSNP